MNMTGKSKPTEQDIKQLRDLEEYEAGKCRTITPEMLARSEAIQSLKHLMNRRHREETLNEDMERQGQPVYNLTEIWKDHSKYVLSEPSSTREDLEQETRKWIRRFDALLDDCLALENDLDQLRNVLRALGQEPTARVQARDGLRAANEAASKRAKADALLADGKPPF
jgi:small-conductance mechanosensitive channel